MQQTLSFANGGTARTLATPLAAAVAPTIYGMHFGPVISAVGAYVGTMLGIQLARVISGSRPGVIDAETGGGAEWEGAKIPDIGNLNDESLDDAIADLQRNGFSPQVGSQSPMGTFQGGFKQVWWKLEDGVWQMRYLGGSSPGWHGAAFSKVAGTSYWKPDPKRKRPLDWYGNKWFERLFKRAVREPAYVPDDVFIGHDDDGNAIWLRPSIPTSIEPGVRIKPCST